MSGSACGQKRWKPHLRQWQDFFFLITLNTIFRTTDNFPWQNSKKKKEKKKVDSYTHLTLIYGSGDSLSSCLEVAQGQK